jgi:Phd_YefM.
MRTWTVTEARANISQVFDAVLAEGPQKVERRDSEPIILVAESSWNRLIAEFPTVADLVLHSGIEAEDLPDRRPARVAGRDMF